MKRFLLTTAAVICVSFVFSDTASAQGGGGGGGGQNAGGFAGADGQFGGNRVTSPDEIQDNRAAAATGENNRALGAGQGGQNNMNFLNALFGGGVNNQTTQSTPLRGRSVRAPFRLGFKFEGADLEQGLKKLNARIVRLPRFKDQEITGVLQKKTLLLIGEVSTQEEADLAGRIARFEPGVEEVKNLLSVSQKIQ